MLKTLYYKTFYPFLLSLEALKSLKFFHFIYIKKRETQRVVESVNLILNIIFFKYNIISQT
jgi:hypothetical protein